MATHTGSEGTVLLSTNEIAEIRDYSIEETGDTVEDTSMGDGTRTFKHTLRSWTASVNCWWDEADTDGQLTLIPGATVTITVLPEGNTSGDVSYSGTAIVTGRTITASFDGMVEASFTAQGTGPLTESTVV